MHSTTTEPLDFIEVHVDGQVVWVRVDEIRCLVEMPDGRTKIVFTDGSEIIADEGLEYFKQTLDTAIIIRTQTRKEGPSG